MDRKLDDIENEFALAQHHLERAMLLYIKMKRASEPEVISAPEGALFWYISPSKDESVAFIKIEGDPQNTIDVQLSNRRPIGYVERFFLEHGTGTQQEVRERKNAPDTRSRKLLQINFMIHKENIHKVNVISSKDILKRVWHCSKGNSNIRIFMRPDGEAVFDYNAEGVHFNVTVPAERTPELLKCLEELI